MRAARACSVALAAALAAGGCRDVGGISEVPRFTWPDTSPRLLTFNLGRDQNPSWAAASDSVLYSAASYAGVPAAKGVLLAAPHTGGTVRPVFGFLHAASDGGAHHVAPAFSPDGERVAFFDIVREAQPLQCVAPPTIGGPCPGREPVLERARLIVRDRDEASGRAPVQLDVVLPGREPRLVWPFVEHTYRYHELYVEDGRIVFTIAWAPDGQRLVFSDGIRLYAWTPGQATSAVIPTGAHAVHPAWSPDGQYIAFTQVTEVAATTTPCSCTGDVPILRTTYGVAAANIALVRPDGSDLRIVRAGEDPTFAPDGALYARVDGRIARIDPETGVAASVPGTEGGYEPVVSPDGRLLAFTRRTPSGGADVWVVELAAP